jgi:glutamyl-tRNA synthetase
MPVEQLLPYAQCVLRDAGWWVDEFAGRRRAWFLGAIDSLRSRLNLLSEFTTRCRAYFRDDFGIEAKARANLEKGGVRQMLQVLADRIDLLEEFTEKTVEREVRSLAAERGVKAGLLINGARAALTGQTVGPSAFRVFTIIGRSRAAKRLRAV